MRERPLILLVDDELSFQEILSTKLNASGFDAVVAKNGKEAVAKAKSMLPDLVLMDINMPGSSGTDAALELKQSDETKALKIVFLTNLPDPWPTVTGDKRTIALALGMEDFLQKTDDLDAIVAKIKEILKKK